MENVHFLRIAYKDPNKNAQNVPSISIYTMEFAWTSHQAVFSMISNQECANFVIKISTLSDTSASQQKFLRPIVTSIRVRVVAGHARAGTG